MMTERQGQSNETELSAPVLARSRAQQPLGRKTPIRTEFVFVDDGVNPDSGETMALASKVGVQGDWNEWQTVNMIRNLEDPRVWTVVTGVPTGYHEFRFIVDGCVQVSSRHPKISSGKCNWRTVLGPARPPVPIFRESLLRSFLRRAAMRLGLIGNPVDLGYFHNARGKDETFTLPSTMKTPQKSLIKSVAHVGAIGAVVIILSAYLIITAFYAFTFGN